jgi:vacuolar-type H+-ATPase subunit F/Vma7
MPAFAYVGNVNDAAGFRLAGVSCWAPAPGAEAAALQAACASAEAVFLATEVARRLPRAELDAALSARVPLVVLLSSDTTPCAFEPAQRVRAQLGLDR